MKARRLRIRPLRAIFRVGLIQDSILRADQHPHAAVLELDKHGFAGTVVRSIETIVTRGGELGF